MGSQVPSVNAVVVPRLRLAPWRLQARDRRDTPTGPCTLGRKFPSSTAEATTTQGPDKAMTSILRRAWFDYVRPLLMRPEQLQVAALCYRRRHGRVEVLLITSLHTGRWIVPKGWPMRGQDGAGTAATEAWEEAGVVVARLGQTPIGSFRYDKRMRGGPRMPCETLIFPVEVARLAEKFPQEGRRERVWLAPDEAAARLDDPGLADVVRELPGRIASGSL